MAKIVDPSASYMSLPMGIARGNPTPIDKTLVWTNEAEMRAYAANQSETALSYVGQILTLVEAGTTHAYVIKDVSGSVEKLPFESEVSGSIGPISGEIENIKGSVSGLSSSIETIAEGMVEMDASLRSAITSAATSAHDNAVIDAGTNMQSYLTNTYTPFVETLDDGVLLAANNAAASGDAALKTAISSEAARAIGEEDKKIDKAQIVASLVSTATNDQVPGAKATYDFVNSTITSLAAYYLTKNAAGDAFATKAELNAAIASGSFYNGGVKVEPKKNDYTIVQEDESHSSGSNPTTRYIFDGTNWAFQYIVNNTTFTAAQLAAINSTITETKLGNITGSISTIESDIVIINGNISTLSSDISTMTGSAGEMSGNIVEMSGSVETVSGSIGTLSGAVSSVSGSIASLSGAASEEIGVITSQLLTITNTLNSLTSTVQDIQTAISGLSGVYLDRFYAEES